MSKSLAAILIASSCLYLIGCSDSSDDAQSSNGQSAQLGASQSDQANGSGGTPINAAGADGAPNNPTAGTSDPAADPSSEAGNPDQSIDPGAAGGAETTADPEPVTEVDPASEPSPDTPADPAANPAPGPTQEPTPPAPPVQPEAPSTEQPASQGPGLAPVSATGADFIPDNDDSPTNTESLSLNGPFTQDPGRGAGPPSVPAGLTLLLQSNDWLKFTWAPSTDDQSVEAYEIYRDGQLIATVRGDSGYEHDYRRWLSTSIVDCNYTRYANCQGGNLQPVPGNSYAYSVAAVDNEGLRSARSPEVIYNFPARSQSAVDLTGYAQVFDEEFNGSVLDRSQWKTSLPWGPDSVVNGELQYFSNTFGANPIAYDPFVLTGDTLQITGVATPPELLAQANNQPYLSGVISTSDYFEMTYGYVEMSAKLASGKGLLSTFYLFNQNFYKSKPEIDIVEYISDRPDKAYQTYHYYDSNRARNPSGEKQSSPTMEAVAGIDLSADFHRYSVLWEPELMIWYIDGVEVQRVTGVRVADEPMNIVAHLVIGSEWIGAPDAQSIPAVFEIDYIKAWQRQ
ncbi:MAG: family 16 glycosylhydrolase [Granulosicoccus sp.]|nr:family 16 glycosylhydrolase [Granulosicoccus sp.]